MESQHQISHSEVLMIICLVIMLCDRCRPFDYIQAVEVFM